MKTFVPALVSLSLLSSIALAAPDASDASDASDEAARAMAEALAAVGSAKALAPPPAVTPPRREPVRDRAQDSACSATPGSRTASPFVLVALATLLRRTRKGVDSQRT